MRAVWVLWQCSRLSRVCATIVPVLNAAHAPRRSLSCTNAGANLSRGFTKGSLVPAAIGVVAFVRLLLLPAFALVMILLFRDYMPDNPLMLMVRLRRQALGD